MPESKNREPLKEIIDKQKVTIPDFLKPYLPKLSRKERIVEYRKARKKLSSNASRAEKQKISSMCIRAFSDDPKDHYLFADDMEQFSGDDWVFEYTNRMLEISEWKTESYDHVLFRLDELREEIY